MTQSMLERSHTSPSLEQTLVGDAMHPGVLTCPLATPLRDVARMMTLYRIHAVVAFNEVGDPGGDEEPWGVVSDLDLVQAAAAGELDSRNAGETAATPVVMITSDDTLARASQLMSEHEVTHLLVADRVSGRPVGVLSTLDLARALAGSVSRC